MKNALTVTCAALVIATGAFLGWQSGHKPKAPRAPVKVSTHMEVNKLANGTVVFQEVPNDGSNITEIAPAAGNGNADPKAPRFQYDPLTQTYRATRDDGSQEIIRDPMNPSKN